MNDDEVIAAAVREFLIEFTNVAPPPALCLAFANACLQIAASQATPIRLRAMGFGEFGHDGYDYDGMTRTAYRMRMRANGEDA